MKYVIRYTVQGQIKREYAATAAMALGYAKFLTECGLTNVTVAQVQ